MSKKTDIWILSNEDLVNLLKGICANIARGENDTLPAVLAEWKERGEIVEKEILHRLNTGDGRGMRKI